jgi:hypothetical protein
VKSPRAVVATASDLTETLTRDGRKAARFYAQFGITEALFRHGVPSGGGDSDDTDSLRVSPSPAAEIEGWRARETATLQDSGSILYEPAPS